MSLCACVSRCLRSANCLYVCASHGVCVRLTVYMGERQSETRDGEIQSMIICPVTECSTKVVRYSP